MGWFISFLLLGLTIYLLVEVGKCTQRAKEAREEVRRVTEDAQERIQALAAEKLVLQKDVISLRPFTGVRDAAAEVERLRAEGAALLAKARDEAEAIRRDSRAAQAEAKAKVEQMLADANANAEKIVSDARKRAEEIGGDAYRALQEADGLKAAITAMKNVVEGYGDRYLIPTQSLLDELGEAYSFDEAGKALVAARERTRSLVTSGRAAECNYADPTRRELAIHFVLDAFNGKVDSILTKVRAENAGTLEQRIRDAYGTVNYNGSAFRGARITPEYLVARLDELHAAAAVQALREREKEEQRRIREQIREEAKARREIERALKEAAREEEALQRAMEKVQQQVARATEQERERFQAQLADLQRRLTEAEARNQRAMSMAQQTKAGHVYVISNIGSFGENVVKIGMTRRLEPYDRIRELGDASVPFEFDVHAMIWTEDAPALERALHQKFVHQQINKVNPRKEFFRVSLSDIKECTDQLGLKVSWTLAAQAAQYRETLAIEKALAEGTPLAQKWLQDQMDFEPDEPLDEAATEGVGSIAAGAREQP